MSWRDIELHVMFDKYYTMTCHHPLDILKRSVRIANSITSFSSRSRIRECNLYNLLVANLAFTVRFRLTIHDNRNNLFMLAGNKSFDARSCHVNLCAILNKFILKSRYNQIKVKFQRHVSHFFNVFSKEKLQVCLKHLVIDREF